MEGRSIISELKNRIRGGLENYFQRYYSSYHARVTQNDDPQKMNRVKLSCPELGIIETQWVNMKGIKSYGSGLGECDIPEIGSNVFIEFKYGDIRQPYCVNAYPFKGWMPDVLKENYPNRIGRRISSDISYYFDRSTSKYVLSVSRANNLSVSTDKIYLGLEQELNTVVKAVEAKKAMNELLAAVLELSSILKIYMDAQTAVATGLPIFAPLIPALQAISVSLTKFIAEKPIIANSINQISSEKVFIEK